MQAQRLVRLLPDLLPVLLHIRCTEPFTACRASYYPIPRLWISCTWTVGICAKRSGSVHERPCHQLAAFAKVQQGSSEALLLELLELLFSQSRVGSQAVL